MTTIQTNLGNTRESARQLRFVPGGTITATNVQQAVEQIGLTLPFLTTPTVVTGTGSIAATDTVVQTNQAAPIVLTLPLSAAWATQNSKYGLPLSIFDISGAASTNSVTINPSGGQTIAGLASLTINLDYNGFRLMPKSTGGWVVV